MQEQLRKMDELWEILLDLAVLEMRAFSPTSLVFWVPEGYVGEFDIPEKASLNAYILSAMGTRLSVLGYPPPVQIYACPSQRRGFREYVVSFKAEDVLNQVKKG